MKNRLAAFILCALAFAYLAAPVLAQESQPGDACSAAGQVIQSGGPEIPGEAHLMICDGANWVSVAEYFDTGESLFQVNYDSGSCTAAKTGRIRYNSASNTWEYCDDAAWSALGGGGSGLWSDSGNGYIEYNSALGGIRIGDVSGQPAPNIIGVTNLNDLGDATISGPANGELLTYNNGTGQWENQAAPGGDNLGNHTATQNLKMSGFWLSNDGGNEGVFVDTAGNVGIGTNAPTKNLSIAGSIATVGLDIENTDSNQKWQIGVKNSTNDGNFMIYNATTASRLLTLTSAGHFGLGTANPDPEYTLDVRETNASLAGWNPVVNISNNHSGVLNDPGGYSGNVGLQVGVTSSVTGTGYDESYGVIANISTANDGEQQTGFVHWTGAETHDADDWIVHYIAQSGTTAPSTGGTQYGLVVDFQDTDPTNYGVHVRNTGTTSWFEGAVGFGADSTPVAPVHVDHNTTIGSTTLSNGWILLSSDNGATGLAMDANEIQFGGNVSYIGTTTAHDLIFRTNGANNRMVIKDTTGRVGIGTASPQRPLEVSDVTPVIRVVDSNSTGAGSLGFLEFYDSALARTGYVGKSVASNSHIYIYSDNGEVIARGTTSGSCTVTTGGCTSDIRLKQKIEGLENSLDKLLQIRGVAYEWKKNPDERYYGVIAQEVERVFPALVREMDMEADGILYKTVNYNGLTAPLIEAVKELKSEKDDDVAGLRQQISAQQMQIDELLDVNDKLAHEINGLKAHTGYGVSKAEISIWVLAFAFSLSSLFFLIGGIFRYRAPRAE